MSTAPENSTSCTVYNQIYNAPVEPNGTETGAYGDEIPVKLTKSTLPYTWIFKQLENGAFHIIAPAPPNASSATADPSLELRATAKSNDLLYVRASTSSENTDPDVVQEWEVLSSARDGGATEPIDGQFKGYYIIAARGDPKRVWMLPDGGDLTQVVVKDLFLAAGPSEADKQAFSARAATTQADSPNWTPRQWLWYIDSSTAN